MYGRYINLESRTDRKEHIERLQIEQPFFSKVTRFNAIRHGNGALGCSLSHIAVIEEFLSTDEEVLLLMEDDFVILNHANFEKFVAEWENIKNIPDWDVIVLTPRGDRMESTAVMMGHHFHRIRNNQTTTGYIVRRESAKILLENIKEGAAYLASGMPADVCAIDQYWKRMQETHSFYYYEFIYGGQLEGFSTIEGRYVAYNDRYITQS
jgi:GR25 family glycosyltransferase involved in LPS biosynthesis